MQNQTTDRADVPNKEQRGSGNLRTVLAAALDSVERRRINWRGVFSGWQAARTRNAANHGKPKTRATVALNVAVLICAWSVSFGMMVPGHLRSRHGVEDLPISFGTYYALIFVALSICIYCLSSLWFTRQREWDEMTEKLNQLEESNRELAQRVGSLEGRRA